MVLFQPQHFLQEQYAVTTISTVSLSPLILRGKRQQLEISPVIRTAIHPLRSRFLMKKFLPMCTLTNKSLLIFSTTPKTGQVVIFFIFDLDIPYIVLYFSNISISCNYKGWSYESVECWSDEQEVTRYKVHVFFPI